MVAFPNIYRFYFSLFWFGTFVLLFTFLIFSILILYFSPVFFFAFISICFSYFLFSLCFNIFTFRKYNHWNSLPCVFIFLFPLLLQFLNLFNYSLLLYFILPLSCTFSLCLNSEYINFISISILHLFFFFFFPTFLILPIILYFFTISFSLFFFILSLYFWTLNTCHNSHSFFSHFSNFKIKQYSLCF